jgi:hypothetical protein
MTSAKAPFSSRSEVLGPLSIFNRSIKRRLITKIITRTDRKLRGEFIKSN